MDLSSARRRRNTRQDVGAVGILACAATTSLRQRDHLRISAAEIHGGRAVCKRAGNGNPC